MAQPNTYALYAWGNYLRETGLDRLDSWLAPAVLSGELVFGNPFLVIHDDLALRVDAARSWYRVGDGHVLGRDLTTPAADWHVAHLRLTTDGTESAALAWIAAIEEGAEIDRVDSPLDYSDPLGEVVAFWEDVHGQWDLALVRE